MIVHTKASITSMRNRIGVIFQSENKTTIMRPFAFLIGMLLSARGMGTIDRAPVRYEHPFRFEGYVDFVRGARSAGPAPIPQRSFNQRQKRKYMRQMA